jgi:hypothetical protein
MGVMIDPDYAAYMARWRAMEKLGPTFGVSLSLVEIRSGADIEKAISDFARNPERAMIVFSSAMTTANRWGTQPTCRSRMAMSAIQE